MCCLPLLADWPAHPTGAAQINPYAARAALLHRPVTTLTSLSAFRATPRPCTPDGLGAPAAARPLPATALPATIPTAAAASGAFAEAAAAAEAGGPEEGPGAAGQPEAAQRSEQQQCLRRPDGDAASALPAVRPAAVQQAAAAPCGPLEHSTRSPAAVPPMCPAAAAAMKPMPATVEAPVGSIAPTQSAAVEAPAGSIAPTQSAAAAATAAMKPMPAPVEAPAGSVAPTQSAAVVATAAAPAGNAGLPVRSLTAADAEAVRGLLSSFLEDLGLHQLLQVVPGPGAAGAAGGAAAAAQDRGAACAGAATRSGALPSGGRLELQWRGVPGLHQTHES